MLRISRLAGLATVVAAFSLIAASSAMATNVSVCQINGAAGGLTPGVQNVQNDLTGVNAGQTISGPGYGHVSLPSTPLDFVLDRDSGTYNFDSAGAPGGVPSVCAQVGTAGNINAGTVHIVSNGSYIDTICGTGEAYSNTLGDGGSTTITPLTTVGTGGFAVPSGIAYDILFAGGSGALTGSYSGGGLAAGYINIAPKTGNCANSDVTEFNVTGGFVAVGP